MDKVFAHCLNQLNLNFMNGSQFAKQYNERQMNTLEQYKKLNTINDAAKALKIVADTFDCSLEDVIPVILAMAKKIKG